MSSSSWTHARSALAIAIRCGESPEKVARLRREYDAARAEHYLRQLVQRDPPLDDSQLVRLAAILTSARSRHYGAT